MPRQVTHLVAFVVVVVIACNSRDDAKAAREKKIRELSREAAELKHELERLQPPVPLRSVPRTTDPMLEQLPEPPAGLDGCTRYIAAVKAYARCDLVPDPAREEMLQGAMKMHRAWSTDMPEAARRAADETCRTGADAVREAAAALGCPLEAADSA